MVTEIDRDELKQKLDHPKKFVLVEALPADYFHKLHLPGAINIPLDQIRNRASELLPREARKSSSTVQARHVTHRTTQQES